MALPPREEKVEEHAHDQCLLWHRDRDVLQPAVFADGEVRDVDIEPLLDGAIFAALRERAEFELVDVDRETGAIAWPNGADLDSDVVYGVAAATREPAARVTTPATV